MNLLDIVFAFLPVFYIGAIIWAVVDLIHRKPKDRVIWVIVVLFVPLGAIAYLIVGRGDRP